FSSRRRHTRSTRDWSSDVCSSDLLDDDAFPDPHWLTYLAATFMSTAHAGVGGPNIAPPGDGPTPACVACAPGGPVHVLLTDREEIGRASCRESAQLGAVGGA